ncbi:MAG: hypothetical protein K8R53_15320, partial [Bacteroidales bacterium]|nr:hypothetical protein [Bacteroidales bacterium]
MNRLKWLLVLLLLLVLSGCRKKEEIRDPQIVYSLPVEGAIYFVPDTIRVEATIKSDRNILQVKLVLVNEGFIPVDLSYSFNPGKTYYTLNFNYPVTNENIESGFYYMKIFVEDEKTTKSGYQPIEMNTQPPELSSVIVISENQDGVGILRLNPQDLTVNMVEQIQVDYADSEINSKNDHLYIAGKFSMNLMAYNLETGQTEWEKPLMLHLPNHYGRCLYFEDNLTATFSTEFIRVFGAQGNILSSSSIEQEERPGNVIRLGNDIVAEIYNV